MCNLSESNCCFSPLLWPEDAALDGSGVVLCAARVARVPPTERRPLRRARRRRLVVPRAQLHRRPAIAAPAALHTALRAPLLPAALEPHVRVRRGNLL